MQQRVSACNGTCRAWSGWRPEHRPRFFTDTNAAPAVPFLESSRDEKHRRGPLLSSGGFLTFFKALAEVQYRGTITFESFSSAIVSPTLSSYDLAVRAHAFVTAQLREPSGKAKTTRLTHV